MDARTKTVIGICAAALCAAAFFAGRITAMDAVVKAEAEMISREMKHEAAVKQLVASMDAFDALLDDSSAKTERVVQDLNRLQEKAEVMQELDALLIKIQSAELPTE